MMDAAGQHGRGLGQVLDQQLGRSVRVAGQRRLLKPTVLAKIDGERGNVEYDLQILRVEALPFGWIFYWGAVWDGQGQRPRLGGNGPFLVDRENERLIRTATSVPVTRQIADYDAKLTHETRQRSEPYSSAVPQPQELTLAAAVPQRPRCDQNDRRWPNWLELLRERLLGPSWRRE
ncbi:hypothetical protein ACF07B_08250 [Streptomyces sp. NPDC015532]|uniref:hypothetical protein n=1 Tax=Streptomyces sp. NPDC015532 TaxID=3364960 RepID=UPI0036FF49C4